MNKIKLKDRTWYIISCTILFVVYLWHLKDVYQISIIGDEYGYWSNAAYLIGLDWSELNSIIPYYSFGYSFLLAPLLAFISSATWRYRTAIVLNAIMYVVSYILSIKVCKKMFKNVEIHFIYVGCFVSAFYVANLYFTTTSSTENLIYLMYWVLIYTLYCYFEDGKWWHLLLAIVETGYMYMVHQRTLGLIVAVVIVLLIWIVSNHKYNIKVLIMCLGTIAVLLFISICIKADIINNSYMWDETAAIAGTNDYKGQFGKIELLFSLKGMKLFVQGYFGRLFYIVVASCGIAIWGALHCIKRIVDTCKLCRKVNADSMISLLCILVMLGMVGVSTIYMLQARRLDSPVYGRYSEFAIAPLLTFGILSILTNKQTIKSNVVALMCPIIFGFTVIPRMVDCSSFFYLQCTGISLFYDSVRDYLNINACIKVSLIFIFIIIFLNKFEKKRLLYAFLGVVMIYWGISANHALSNDHLYWQNYCKSLQSIVDKIEENSDLPVYLLYDSEVDDWPVCSRICVVQSYLPKTNIKLISDYTELPMEDHYLLIQEENRGYDEKYYKKLDGQCFLVLLEK